MLHMPIMESSIVLPKILITSPKLIIINVDELLRHATYTPGVERLSKFGYTSLYGKFLCSFKAML